jgi:hypothetical protein
MVIVAVIALVVFAGPASVCIFLSLFVFVPVFGSLAIFYLLILVTAVTLDRNPDNAGINNLPFSGLKALFAKKVVKSSEAFAILVAQFPGLTTPTVIRNPGPKKTQNSCEGLAIFLGNSQDNYGLSVISQGVL